MEVLIATIGLYILICFMDYVEGDNGVWPRAVVYDLYCDTSGEDKPPKFTYEYPALTYRCK